MNALLWILQALLAFHTAMGAVWKFSNPAQSIPSLQTIPNWLWLVLAGAELLCALGLILPAIRKRWSGFAPPAGTFIASEMILFSVIHIASGAKGYDEVIYWMVVAALSGAIAYARMPGEADSA